MTQTADFQASARLCVEYRQSRSICESVRSIAATSAASNDNFACFEQYVFERAAMRELSGDVDF